MTMAKLDEIILLTTAKTLELQDALLKPGQPASQATIVPLIRHPQYETPAQNQNPEPEPSPDRLDLFSLAT